MTFWWFTRWVHTDLYHSAQHLQTHTESYIEIPVSGALKSIHSTKTAVDIMNLMAVSSGGYEVGVPVSLTALL